MKPYEPKRRPQRQQVMTSQWSLFCPATGPRHEGWGCASCLATNPLLRSRGGQEVVDLDPPHPQAATSIFPQNVTRFPYYSRVYRLGSTKSDIKGHQIVAIQRKRD